MSRNHEIVDVVNIDKALGRTLSEFAEKNTILVATKLQQLPRKFRNAVLGFYFSVLKTRTKRLKGSFKEFARQVDNDSMEYGMRSDVAYARIQHEGGYVPERFPVNKKAMRWFSPKGKPIFAKRARGFHIKPKYYFSKPMETETNKLIDELKEEIDW